MTNPQFPDSLQRNLEILNDSEQAIAKVLCDAGQGHLFSNWPAPGSKDNDKHRFLTQAADINSKYPGGIQRYVDNAKKLLKASAEGVNPFEGFTPSVPTGETLHFNTIDLDDAEKLGLEAIPYTGFVLVAGGLGERLGYNHIKIALPVDVISQESFIQHYIEFILAYQDRARLITGKHDLILPLAIMTSDDTHAKTVELMQAHRFFCMEEKQVTIVKQDKVPALMDNDAHFVLDEKDQFSIMTKPHGHGDVHTLLHQHHVIESWIQNYGTQYIFFFQDTNGAVFRAFPAALGMSVKRQFEVNSLSVPRKPGEAVGAICTLKSNTQSLTINVEYNQLDPLLRATVNPEGDVADPKTGFSPFPGNINALIFAAQPYLKVLQKCGGSVPEFCNPKYADSSKTKFKSPTRLECMMQDYPRLLGPSAKVGFTQMDRFMTFTAVKNNLVDGLAKHKSTGFSETAAAGESDLFSLNLTLLKLGGSKVSVQGGDRLVEYSGIPVIAGPRIALAPSFGVTLQEIRDALHDCEISLTERSSVLLKGRGSWKLGKIQLDGALAVETVEGSECILEFVKEKNSGIEFKAIDSKDKSADERFSIRGYMPVVHAQRLIRCTNPGEHKLVKDIDA